MKEVLQIAYLRHLQDFYLFESVKDGIYYHDQSQNQELFLYSLHVYFLYNLHVPSIQGREAPSGFIRSIFRMCYNIAMMTLTFLLTVTYEKAMRLGSLTVA